MEAVVIFVGVFPSAYQSSIDSWVGVDMNIDG